MIAEDFRRLALLLPEAIEHSHMGHPDFRVRGKIFATLGHPDDGRAMVKLTHEQQDALTAARPDVFGAVPVVGVDAAPRTSPSRPPTRVTVSDALLMAWLNTAPKRLVAAHPSLRSQILGA